MSVRQLYRWPAPDGAAGTKLRSCRNRALLTSELGSAIDLNRPTITKATRIEDGATAEAPGLCRREANHTAKDGASSLLSVSDF